MLIPVFVAYSAKLPYRFEARFVEACSCKDACVTEITGRDAGCHGIGAIAFKSGSYGGQDLSGTSVAFAFDSGKWVRIYVDGPSRKRTAATAMMKAALADWGKLEAVNSASVRINPKGKGFELMVDKGRTASVEVKPVMGADGVHAVTHNNLSSPLHSVLMQGETTAAALNGTHPFQLKSTNGFFNAHTVMKGRL